MVEEFPANTNTGKAQKTTPGASKPDNPKKLQRITDGEAVQRKVSRTKRFRSVFFSGDTKGALGIATMDVLVPSAKNMLAEAVRQVVDQMLWGSVQNRSPGQSIFRAGVNSQPYTPYQRASGGGMGGRRDAQSRPLSSQARASHDFNEIVLASRGDAERVIDTLIEIVQEYSVASISDLYQLVGIRDEYTDRKYGWNTLQGATVRSVRGGYLLDLPRPVPLD